MEALGKNLLPSSFRLLAVFSSLLAVSRGPLSRLLKAARIPSCVLPSIFKPAMAHRGLLLMLQVSLPSSSVLRFVWLDQAHWDSLPVLRSAVPQNIITEVVSHLQVPGIGAWNRRRDILEVCLPQAITSPVVLWVEFYPEKVGPRSLVCFLHGKGQPSAAAFNLCVYWMDYRNSFSS